MHDNTPADEAANDGFASPKGGKARLLRLEDLDRRTGVYKQVAETIDRVEADLGGADSLSAAQRQLVRHAVLSGAMADDLATRWLAGEPVEDHTPPNTTDPLRCGQIRARDLFIS
jgi:hypothetical protein